MATLHGEIPVTPISNHIPPKFEIGGHTIAYDIKESGSRIRQLRIPNGYTQEKLAEVLNVDQSYYGRIETGKRGCPVDLFIQLSDLFGVSLDYLIRGRSSSNLPGDAAVTQLKSDIDNLVEQLERFKISL